MAKASVKDVFIDQERRCGDRRRSDTVVVRTVNHANVPVGVHHSHLKWLSWAPGNKSLGSGGSMNASLKLKGIDGRAPPGVEPAA